MFLLGPCKASMRRARSAICTDCAISNVSKMSLAIFCRLRVPSTMTFKFSDNLALAQNMPVTVSNVPFGMREMSYGERPIHVPLWVGVVFGQLVRFPLSLHARTNYAASGADCVRVGGSPSSLEAASSQTWASCRKDTRVSFVWASRAHLKHSSAIARYSAAVFMGRSTSFQRNWLRRFAQTCLL